MIPKSVAAIIDEKFLEEEASKYLTRKERKAKKKSRGPTNHRQPVIPNLCRISPKTAAQRIAYDAFHNDRNLILHGCAGTGKTFLALS